MDDVKRLSFDSKGTRGLQYLATVLHIITLHLSYNITFGMKRTQTNIGTKNQNL